MSKSPKLGFAFATAIGFALLSSSANSAARASSLWALTITSSLAVCPPCFQMSPAFISAKIKQLPPPGLSGGGFIKWGFYAPVKFHYRLFTSRFVKSRLCQLSSRSTHGYSHRLAQSFRPVESRCCQFYVRWLLVAVRACKVQPQQYHRGSRLGFLRLPRCRSFRSLLLQQKQRLCLSGLWAQGCRACPRALHRPGLPP